MDGNGNTILDKSCGAKKPAAVTSQTNKWVVGVGHCHVVGVESGGDDSAGDDSGNDDSGNHDSGNNTTAGTSTATVMVVTVLTAIVAIETTWLRTHPTHCYDHGHDGHGHVDHGDDDTTAGWRWSSTPTTRSPAPASRSTGLQFEEDWGYLYFILTMHRFKKYGTHYVGFLFKIMEFPPSSRWPARSTGTQFENFNQSIITKDNLLWYNMISKLLLNLYLYYLIDCSL